MRPNLAHQTGLPDLADDLGLGHLLTDWVGAPGEGLRSQGLPLTLVEHPRQLVASVRPGYAHKNAESQKAAYEPVSKAMLRPD